MYTQYFTKALLISDCISLCGINHYLETMTGRDSKLLWMKHQIFHVWIMDQPSVVYQSANGNTLSLTTFYYCWYWVVGNYRLQQWSLQATAIGITMIYTSHCLHWLPTSSHCLHLLLGLFGLMTGIINWQLPKQFAKAGETLYTFPLLCKILVFYSLSHFFQWFCK